MAEDKSKTPSDSLKSAVSGITKKNEYDPALAAKYEMHSSLQPTMVDFGYYYGGLMVDLREPCIDTIDQLCKAFPDQPFFKKK